MKTRSFIFGLTLFLAGFSTLAQKGEVSAANAALENYDGLRTSPGLALPYLQKAKMSIEKAVVHEKTKNDPAAWAIRANVYANYANIDTAAAKLEAAVAEAVKSIAKSRELDTKGEQKSALDIASESLYTAVLNKGAREYKAGTYTKAYSSFDQAGSFVSNGRDTMAVYYAGVSAQYAKDYNNAIKKYSSLLNSNFSYLQDVYANLSVIYLVDETKKDTVTAIKIASEGAAKFPNNALLATREIEFSLMIGKEKEIIDKITAQAAKEPNNKIFPYYLGLAYGTSKDYPKAEAAYQKALQLDPTFVNAAINLSGLIMNSGIEIFNAANGIDYIVKGKIDVAKKAKYDEGMKTAKAEFERAYPFLLKATELDPKSSLAWRNLKMYYQIKEQNDKVEEIQKKIDAL